MPTTLFATPVTLGTAAQGVSTSTAPQALVAETAQSILDQAEQFDDGVAATQTLTRYSQTLEKEMARGSASEATLKLVTIATEGLSRRLDIPCRKYTAESLQDRSRRARTFLAMEGLGDFLEAVWDKIVAIFNGIVDFFKNLFFGDSLDNVDEQLESRINKLILEVKTTKPFGMTGIKPNGADWDVPYSFMQVDNKFLQATDLRQDAEAFDNHLAIVYETLKTYPSIEQLMEAIKAPEADAPAKLAEITKVQTEVITTFKKLGGFGVSQDDTQLYVHVNPKVFAGNYQLYASYRDEVLKETTLSVLIDLTKKFSEQEKHYGEVTVASSREIQDIAEWLKDDLKHSTSQRIKNEREMTKFMAGYRKKIEDIRQKDCHSQDNFLAVTGLFGQMVRLSKTYAASYLHVQKRQDKQLTYLEKALAWQQNNLNKNN